jgi:hypothetical protein
MSARYRASGPVRARFPHGRRARGLEMRTLRASARRTAVVVNTVAVVATAVIPQDADVVLGCGVAGHATVVPRAGTRKPDWRLPVCSTASSATMVTRTPQ